MPVINRIGDMAPEMTEWRRWLHRNPELGFDCFKTAAYVAERLRDFGVDEIHEGIATTGIVAIIEGKGAGPTIGLRADMDALPLDEMTGAAHASETPGVMHACGHDGHTTMLLGAAKYLAETRNFAGRVALIFQPAEEGPGGGRVMVEEGIMERFGVTQVYALHNSPTTKAGLLGTRPGAIMAAADEFEVVVRGRGGHAAWPHVANDPMTAAFAMVQAIQTINSRNRPPLSGLVVSVNLFNAGTATNIIPAECRFAGTIRSFEKSVQEMTFQRLREIVAGTAAAHGLEAEIEIELGYPATVNHAAETQFAAEVAAEVVGAENVDAETSPQMAGEDFAYMLEARPGCYLFLGQGEGPNCHHPAFDFNDEVAPIGASLFARLVERAQPLG
jgi:hippurate hydrolase